MLDGLGKEPGKPFFEVSHKNCVAVSGQDTGQILDMLLQVVQDVRDPGFRIVLARKVMGLFLVQLLGENMFENLGAEGFQQRILRFKVRIEGRPPHVRQINDTFVAYNKRDVEVEMQIATSLRNVTPPHFVWQEYWDSEDINDRGIAVDRQLVNQAIRLDALSQEQSAQQLREITGVANPRSVTQMKQWLSQAGLSVDTLGKKDVQEMMKGAQEPLRSILALRLELAKSSVKKYTAMKNAVCADG